MAFHTSVSGIVISVSPTVGQWEAGNSGVPECNHTSNSPSTDRRTRRGLAAAVANISHDPGNLAICDGVLRLAPVRSLAIESVPQDEVGTRRTARGRSGRRWD